MLLHAGPPLADPTRPPTPMLNAAVLSCLHEGWARTPEEAERLLASGAVRLEPSYHASVATPLVAMVSPKTTLAEISDAADSNRRYYAFLGTGAGPQQRFGTRDPAILERLAFRETVLAPGFTELLDAPVDSWRSPAPPSAKATTCTTASPAPPPSSTPSSPRAKANQTPPRPPCAPSPKRRSTS